MKTMDEALKLHPKLYQRYREAFANQVAKLLVNPDVIRLRQEYGLTDEQIHQSLPELRQWLIEKDHCKNCPGLKKCPNMYVGHFTSPSVVNGSLYFNWSPCVHQESFIIEERQKGLLRSHLIPAETLQVTFKDLETDAGNIEAVKAAILFCKEYGNRKGRGLYLYGEFGVGKTYLMGAIAKQLVEQGISVYFVHVPAFLRELKSSLGDQSFATKIQELEGVDCLILDDIGSENLSPWIRDEVLGPLIQYRTQNRKPILYTSNFDLELLQEHLSQTNQGEIDIMKSLRIMERIRSYSDAYFMGGKNRRNKT